MKKTQLFVFSIFFTVLIIFTHSLGYLSPIENILGKAFLPLGKVLNQTANSGKGIFSWAGGLKNLQKENKDLRSKMNEAEAEIASLQEAKKENESLRKNLDFKINSGYEILPASVSFYDPSSTKQSVIIDQGESDGVKKGMAVINEGFLVGKIIDTSANSSKVMLITDPASAIPVTVQNSTATGSLKGQIGFGLSLEKVPQGDVLKQGQLVITSGLGGDYPKGLIVGKIDKIEKSDNAIFQTASVRPEINFRLIERVLVIIK